jgi:hypothetical protein
MMLEFTVGKNIRQRVRAQSMKETTISIIDALRGQQAQLKRLLAQKVWISDAPRPELSEIEAQVIEVKRLLAELEKNIQDQLQRGHAPRP